MRPENEIWRLHRVMQATGMGRTWHYDAVKRGEFPAPLRLSERAIGWRRADVEAWIESREKAA